MVAYRFLEEVELTDLERSAAIPLCKHFHQSTRELSEQFANELGRHNYVTPTSYLELISSFKSVLANKRGNVLKMKKRYEVGLEKLKFAASQVMQFSSVFSAKFTRLGRIPFTIRCGHP